MTNNDFRMWEKEINAGFYVDNFNANPILFSGDEIEHMPLLGNWTLNEFCMHSVQRQQQLMEKIMQLELIIHEQREQISFLHKQFLISQNEQMKTNKSIAEILSLLRDKKKDNEVDNDVGSVGSVCMVTQNSMDSHSSTSTSKKKGEMILMRTLTRSKR